MRARWILPVILLSGCQTATVGAGKGISTPSNWPLRSITLPTGAQAEEFKPAEGAPTKDVESFTVFFSYPESPDDVMRHFESEAVSTGMTESERQEIDPGGAQDSRRLDWLTKDKLWTVSIRYWKINGLYPYELIIAPTSNTAH